MSYGLQRIASEIEDTALGRAYYGNSIYVARDLPFLTEEEVRELSAALDGEINSWRLQEIANKIRAH